MSEATVEVSTTSELPRPDVGCGPHPRVTLADGAASDDGADEIQANRDPHITADLAGTVSLIQERFKMRVDYVRAQNRLVLQIKAVLRRFSDGDKDAANALYKKIASGGDLTPSEALAAGHVLPLFEAIEPLEKARKVQERELRRLAKSLPVWQWVETVRGVGPLALAQIIGCTGNLSNYSTFSKVWKRMGLAVIGGERQRKVANDSELAIIHGYSPERRAVMFVIGECLVKSGDEYRRVYLERKATEHQKALDEGLIPATTTAATVKNWESLGLPPLTLVKEFDKAHHRGAQHMAIRAQRYMEKRLLRNLWGAWRQYTPVEEKT